MRILAIDPGSYLGWSTDSTGRLDWGTEGFSVARGESPGMRFIRFRRWLDEKAGGRLDYGQGPPQVGLIVYEMPHLRGGAATDVLVGMTTIVQTFCAEHGIEHTQVHSATLKKYALGNAPRRKKADPKMDRSKEAIILAAKRRAIELGIVGAAAHFNEHEADALWLYWWAKENCK